MAKLPAGVDSAELTVVARRILLDALAALGPHRRAAVLVGAQAVYFHTEGARLGGAAYTSDGDLGIDVGKLGDDPLIEVALHDAEFTREHPDREPQPGIWWKKATVSGQEIRLEVDLLVAAEAQPGTRRGVSAPPHDRQALRRLKGIGAALEDHSPQVIAGFEPDDSRQFPIEIAGVAALLIAKAHKLGERLARLPQRPDRLIDKDASDVLGLMLVSAEGIDDIAQTLLRLAEFDYLAESVTEGVNYLRQLFGSSGAPGVTMAIHALAGVKAPSEITLLAPAYVAQLPRL
jgi:hypothetical protein